MMHHSSWRKKKKEIPSHWGVGGWEQMNKIPLQNKRTQEIQPRGKTHPQPRSEATTTIQQNYTI
jgi:hypothetical protein